MRSSALAFVAAFALSTSALVQPASATTLSGLMNVDNLFTAYLSIDDTVLGTPIGSGNSWPTTYPVGGPLTSGVTNYLHIVATDTGQPAMFIGQFSLDDTGFSFSNGTQYLLTNGGITSNWLVSKTGFGLAYATPTDEGPNGCCAWGNISAVDANARFIWADVPGNTVYFSTTLTPARIVGGVPEPGTLMLLGGGLLSLAGLRRRRSRAK